MATDHDTVSPIEHDETANLRLALMERWRESCGRAAERFGRRSDIPFYSSALSALAGECADDMGKSGRVAEAAVAMLADALMVGRCEFLCEYQDEIDEVYHGLFEKRI